MYIKKRLFLLYHGDLLANHSQADLAALARIFEKAASTYSREGDNCTALALLAGSKTVRDRAAMIGAGL